MLSRRSEPLEKLRSEVADVCARHIGPLVERYEREHRFPRQVMPLLGEHGWLGYRMEPQASPVLDVRGQAVIIEELSRVNAGIGVSVLVQVLMAYALARYGTAVQRERYLSRIRQGDVIGAVAATEPDYGSDLAHLKTSAVPVAGGFRLEGRKTFITNAPIADLFLVAARVPSEDGIACFLVERSSPGVRLVRHLDKLGWHTSETGELVFDGCPVPAENCLARGRSGFRNLLDVVNLERVFLAAQAVGIARAAFDAARHFAAARVQFGQPIASFQVIRHTLVDMHAEIEQARLLTEKACADFGTEEGVLSAALAKWISSEMVKFVTDRAVQIFGGRGCIADFPIERFYRDARIYSIGGGTTEIQKETVAKRLGL